jgi:hypothetical protein
VKEDDPELLYYAGSAALVTRRPKEAQAIFQRYLEAAAHTETPGDQRRHVRRLLPGLNASAAAAAPSSAAGPASSSEPPNWMSGARTPRNAYYCPLSLAFGPRIERIEASNKMRAAFEWSGNKLIAIRPSFEKENSGEKAITFAYDDRVPQVAAVTADGNASAPPRTDPDAALLAAALVLPNHPDIDPSAARTLGGAEIAIGFAGNRYFNPFVWERVYPFRLYHDDQGRLVRAREITDVAKGTLGNLTLEFEWDGMQLESITGYEGPDEKTRTRVYERTLQYEGGRLMGEEIQSSGRQGKIRYTYKGDKLISASCDKNAALDNRSRTVMFSAN